MNRSAGGRAAVLWWSGTLLLFTAVAGALTWPAVAHLDEVIIGGGELGGWLWRHWWHVTELEALAAADLGPVAAAEAFVSLGRFPETGNVLDVLLLAGPLQGLFGLPLGYNLEVLLVLVGNGLCGALLARSLVDDPVVAAAAGLVAMINPMVLQDVEASGLRQVLLWWLLLLPIPLARALETRSLRQAGLAGLLWGLAGGFYWFYGLFAGIFVVLRVGAGLWRRGQGRAWVRELPWLGVLAVTTVLVSLPLMWPYLEGLGRAAGTGSVALPELRLFEAYPAYEVVREVPLRPMTPDENLLSSLNRAIMSSWSPDYLVNPFHGRAFPLAVALLGVLPLALSRRFRDRTSMIWLLVFTVFFLGTLGPFLKAPGGQADAAAVVLLGDQAVRLPWTWMYRWIPGMSRMFGPYRLGALVVVASVALLALGLGRLSARVVVRRVVAALVIAGSLVQVTTRWRVELGPDSAARPSRLRAPLAVSPLQVPPFYQELPVGEPEGLIELPLDQQQDLLCFFQRYHQRKVYRSWATAGALPPFLRGEERVGLAGELLRHLASQDPVGDPAGEALVQLSRDPAEVDLGAVPEEDLDRLLVSGSYRHVVVHERGYYLVDPRRGGELFDAAVASLETWLGVEGEPARDLAWVDYPGNPVQRRAARVPWSAQKVALGDDEVPSAYRMAVFDLGERLAGLDAEALALPGAGGTEFGVRAPGRDQLVLVTTGLGVGSEVRGVEQALVEVLERPPTVRFTAAHAQTTRRTASLGSLLTGLYPSAVPLCGLGADPAKTGWCESLPEGVPTLPRVLEEVGYAVGGLVVPVASAETLAEAHRDALTWWSGRAGQPRLLVLVLADAIDPEDLAQWAGGLVGELSQTGNPQPLWVVLTGTVGDGDRDPTHVPLTLFGPPEVPVRGELDTPVELVDLLPSLVALAGGLPEASRPGRNLLTDGDGVGAYTEDRGRLSLRVGDHRLTFRHRLGQISPLDPALTRALLEATLEPGGAFQLHDLAVDPTGTEDLLAARPELARELHRQLVERRTGPAAPAEERIRPAQLAALRGAVVEE